jgi:cytoskeletal protein CcmA (bactofilin family)
VFEPRTSRKPTPSIGAETVLSNEIRLEGRLHSTTSIRFDGEMLGDVTTEGDLVVGQGGR